MRVLILRASSKTSPFIVWVVSMWVYTRVYNKILIYITFSIRYWLNVMYSIECGGDYK